MTQETDTENARDTCPDCGGVGSHIGTWADPRGEVEAYHCMTENCEREWFAYYS